VHTNRGEFEILLWEDVAPRTSAHFVGLAESGFYRQLTFHRVVPNFVIQGGDPRGDGEGGPAETIRCETSARSFDEGVVGVALSGKDTGGSQFFVTLSRQPHLDGRYTAFGQVKRGLDVVRSILEGDVILDITVLRKH
jgi:cyclophilin family peptidyl-prolyl cis-trans isomerase